MTDWMLFSVLGLLALVLALGWPIWALILITGLQLMPDLGIVEKLTGLHLVAGYGVVVALRLFMKPPPGQIGASELRLLAVSLIGFEMLSMAWAKEPLWALDGLFKYGKGIAFGWLLSLFVRSRRELLGLLYVAVIIAVIGTLITIYGVVALGMREGGAGLSDNPNGNAFFFLVVLPLAYSLVRATEQVWLRRLFVVAPPLLSIGIIATGSRSAMLAAALLWVLFLIQDRRSMTLYVAFALGAVGVAAALPFMEQNVERIRNLAQLTEKHIEEGSLAGRKALAVNGTVAFLERPFWGYGVRNGRLRVAELMYRRPKGTVTTNWLATHTSGGRGDLHNTYLTLAVDVGLPGLGLFCLIGWIAIRDLRRLARGRAISQGEVAALTRYLPAGIIALLFLLLFMNQLHSPLLWLVLLMPATLRNVLVNTAASEVGEGA
jgi:O-antigen ligase